MLHGCIPACVWESGKAVLGSLQYLIVPGRVQYLVGSCSLGYRFDCMECGAAIISSQGHAQQECTLSGSVTGAHRTFNCISSLFGDGRWAVVGR